MLMKTTTTGTVVRMVDESGKVWGEGPTVEHAREDARKNLRFSGVTSPSQVALRLRKEE